MSVKEGPVVIQDVINKEISDSLNWRLTTRACFRQMELEDKKVIPKAPSSFVSKNGKKYKARTKFCRVTYKPKKRRCTTKSREEKSTKTKIICRICMEDAAVLRKDSNSLTVTPCGHLFCLNCITHWVNKIKRRKCPVCREVFLEPIWPLKI